MEQYYLLSQQLQRIEKEEEKKNGDGENGNGFPLAHSLVETPSLVVLLLEEMCRRAGPPSSSSASSPSVWCITPLLMAWHQDIHKESQRLKVEAEDEDEEEGKIKREGLAHDHARPPPPHPPSSSSSVGHAVAPTIPTLSASVPALFHLSLQEATHTVDIPFSGRPTPQDGVGLSTSVLSCTQLESFLLLFLLDAHASWSRARHASWPSLAVSGSGPKTTKEEEEEAEKNEKNAVPHEMHPTPTQGISSSVSWMTPLVLRTIAGVWREEGQRPRCADPHTAAQLVLHAGVVAHCTPYLS